MKRSFAAVAAVMLAAAAPALAMNTVMVGGQPMYPNKTIVANAVNSADHTTLIAAVKAAGLADTLGAKGPFTVLAPTNEAFAALPAGTLDMLLKPENKATLTRILTYHVLPGDWTAARLRAAIRRGHGEAVLATVAGGTLDFTMNGSENIVVRDAKGDVADISIYDVTQSNGVIQVIDRVLLPG